MRQVTCKNCGAVFSENLEKCPYCGTMNRKGAYRSFRMTFAGMVDQMLGLKDEVNQTTGKMILSAFLRSLVFIAVIIGIAFGFSRTARINYYSDPEYDQEAYETILWEDENLDKLDEAYAKNDFKTIKSLYAENSKVVHRWPNYANYVLKERYQNIMDYPHFSVYELQNVLYYLYFPDFFTYGHGMENLDAEQYESMRQSLLKMMAEKGYTEQELADIYAKHADSYGYTNISELEAYVKE